MILNLCVSLIGKWSIKREDLDIGGEVGKGEFGVGKGMMWLSMICSFKLSIDMKKELYM